MLSFLSRLAPYRKAVIAAVGAVLTYVAQSGALPVDSTAAHVVAAVLAIGTTLGVWAIPNRLLPPASAPAPVVPITSTTTGGGTTPAA